MKPIYKPKGAAAEYADLALNIYTGCNNGCTYCYAPGVLRKTREAFSANVQMRPGLLEALEKQLAGGNYEGETIHLCFTCDPFPLGIDYLSTYGVVKLLKDAGCHIQILTKNVAYSSVVWHMLDKDDWVGTTITGDLDGVEPNAECPARRTLALYEAAEHGFHTWISYEPVLDPEYVLQHIEKHHLMLDLIKIGKLNHQKSDIDWYKFGHDVEDLCNELDVNYVIKDSLRKEMERDKR